MTDQHDSIWMKWKRFRSLPPFEQKTVVRAMLLLPLTKFGLQVMGFRRWKRILAALSPLSHCPQVPESIEDRAERTARAVRSAERHGIGTPNCLERSLTLWWLLRRAGIQGELHIGARKSGVKFEAHAWVERNGTVLNDDADIHMHYSRFDAPIAAGEDVPRPVGEAAPR